MELKRDQFFDWEKILTKNVISMITSHPQEMEKVLTYVFDEITKLWEYMWKKNTLEKEFDKNLHKLKEEYHITLTD